ncbi:hypothetical protein CFC21_053879 [Triticum aestivum]|uniref:ACT domain-containing protein ACR n=2 Tax=Triticum aestivum TaxID=4565 RepID=A0A9R1GCU5_WHEAT|nr:hypothetical protein CFC21_053879 [Triticum aestivum]
MGIPNDEVVQIRQADAVGDPTMVTVSCPDKIGLGCDLCRIVLLLGLNILKAGVGGPCMAWNLLKERLVELCPVPALFGIDISYLAAAGLLDNHVPQVFLLKFCCFDSMGLLHHVTRVLCEMELTIMRVKVSTTPDGRVMDLCFITDGRELPYTKSRKDEAYERLQNILGDSVTSCEIESVTEDMTEVMEQILGVEEQLSCSCLSVTMANSLSPAHTLIQMQCGHHKGLLYDILRTLKDCNIQISYGRYYVGRKGDYEVDLFVVRPNGKKIIDELEKSALCSCLRVELRHLLHVAMVNRDHNTELLVANPVEVPGKGRPLVLHDITLILKDLEKRIFLIGRHVVDDGEWELTCAMRSRIVDSITSMLMVWD